MDTLKASRTEANLNNAAAVETCARKRYLDFATRADSEGYDCAAAVFRDGADRRNSRAAMNLETLEAAEARAESGQICCATDDARSAIMSDLHQASDRFAGMTRKAHEEGFDEIADWFETLAKAGRSRALRLRRALGIPAGSGFY